MKRLSRQNALLGCTLCWRTHTDTHTDRTPVNSPLYSLKTCWAVLGLTGLLSGFEWHDTSPTCQLAEALLEYAAAFAH